MKVNLTTENFKSDYFANLMRARGVEDLEKFINPDDDCLGCPADLENIDAGSALIQRAAAGDNKRFCVIVDSDCDGMTSAAIIVQYVNKVWPNVKVDYRLHEGKQHGLEDHIEDLMRNEPHYDLVICPDSSSNDFDYHEELGGIGTPVLVLDHHEVDIQLSDNAVVINNQLSPRYRNKQLTGAGVAWQFCRYLDADLGLNYADDLIDLAALGVDGDMGSVLDLENRYIMQNGFSNIKNFFFRTLVDKQSYSMGNKVNPISVAFYIVPMINAMIRMGTMPEKERLFRAFVNGQEMVISKKRGAAPGSMEMVAVESARECTNAKTKQNKIIDEAIGRLEIKIFKHDLLENKILFVRLDEGDDFPSEINGLVAMKLSQKYKKPTIIGRLGKDGMIKGSIRGLSNCELTDFKEFLTESGLFEYVQGHANAAGHCIEATKLDELHRYANAELASIDFNSNMYDVDFERLAADKDIIQLVFDVAQHEDVWGTGCPEPKIHIKDLNFNHNDIQIMGKNKDTVKITKFGVSYMKFHAKELIEELGQHTEIKMNIVGKMNLNEYFGNVTPQIFIDSYDIMDGNLAF